MEEEPKIENSFDRMAAEIQGVSREALEKYSRGEISADDVEKRVLDQVRVAIDMLVS